MAVKDSVNQAKGDKDTAECIPSYSGATCRYMVVDGQLDGKSALTSYANSCSNVTLTVTYAY